MPKVKNKSQLAKELGVSRSSLYYKSKMEAKDLELAKQIRGVHLKHPAYGHKRLAMELKINKKRVLRVMNKFNIKPPRRRLKKPVKERDFGNPAVDYPNLLTNLEVLAPDIVWASDFTYIKFQGKFIYVATVTDIFTRRIVGWQISNKHNSSLVKAAFEDAFRRTNKTPKISHSDQGSEYTSKEHIQILEGKGIKVSFSAKASPWQNGYQESLYSGFKLDLGYIDRFKNIGELVAGIHQTIHYYNNSRIHTKLKMSPTCFYKQVIQLENELKGDNNKLLSNKMGT